MASNLIEPIRGMPDILPKDIGLWHLFEKEWHALMVKYGYSEIRTPIVEKTNLFKRSIGEVTDIIEKEMFSFFDKGKNPTSISLRPEGTASCVRAALTNGLIPRHTQNLWYYGPMFRYEAPQKGRYRQFYQVGLESFGTSGVGIELEHLLIISNLWKNLNINHMIQLEINCLGTLEARNQYKEILVQYLQDKELDEDSKRRLTTNPLRILDSKNPAMQEIIQNAPKLLDHIDENSKANFEKLKQSLEHLQIEYKVNPNIVRGLDYYNDLVYEWTTTELGAQSAVCAGGRFDSLISQLGCKDNVPAVGLAMGVERIVLLLEKVKTLEEKKPDIYFIYCDDASLSQVMQMAESIRHNSNLKVQIHLTENSLKSKFKKADQSGAKLVVVLGESELEKQQVNIKFLREKKQEEVSFDSFLAWMKRFEENLDE